MQVLGSEREHQAWAQLAQVTDPELDQSVTELDFIDQLDIDEHGDVCVRFRLPTYWCAANFAFMMGSDMREKLGELPWVRQLRVELLDHFYADSINQGLATGASFEQTCGGEASGGLALLRATFRRKAFYSRQERLIEHLRVRCGTPKEALVTMRVADLAAIDMAEDEEGRHLRERYLAMRRQGAPDEEDNTLYSGDAEKAAFVSAAGEELEIGNLSAYLRHLRTIRLNSEFNATLCRSVLDARKKHGDVAPRDLGPLRLVRAAQSQ